MVSVCREKVDRVEIVNLFDIIDMFDDTHIDAFEIFSKIVQLKNRTACMISIASTLDRDAFVNVECTDDLKYLQPQLSKMISEYLEDLERKGADDEEFAKRIEDIIIDAAKLILNDVDSRYASKLTARIYDISYGENIDYLIHITL